MPRKSYAVAKGKGVKMKKLDMHWMSNRDWWELKNHIPTVEEDAPIEARVSYERYKEQLKSTAV